MTGLESLQYSRGSLKVIDQLLLPHELVWIELKTTVDAWTVIRTMQVRGAPLIAIVAALGLAVEVHNQRNSFDNVEKVMSYFTEKFEYLRTSRPTAVNLFTATDELKALTIKLSSEQGATAASVIDGFITAAENMLAEDIATNRAIGAHGAKAILQLTGKSKVKVLTICNTGSLATAGFGTALGVVRALHESGNLEHVYACETRPYNQGARLTAFEIVHDKLPGILITDSMASALIALKGVDVVVVGADRVTANGDTANKIGTYQLAITAKYHGIPFFPAVPTTTIDLKLSSGSLIHIEQRPAHELTSIFGQKIAPDGIDVWNPSFDVTPSSLITGIITELGVATTSVDDVTADGTIDLAAFFRSKGVSESKLANSVAPTTVPPGFVRLDANLLGEYVLSQANVRQLLGYGDESLQEAIVDLDIKEVGDGNINFVYIVESKKYAKKVVVKQALPFVRCVGESWPLTLERATFEYKALVEDRKYAPDYVPEVYHFDRNKAVIVMRYIEPPHQILRKSLIEGTKLESVSTHVAQYLAPRLFHTSALALSGAAFRQKVSQWSRNTSMCSLTEKVIFTDPYQVDQYNRWTTPQLDVFAEGIRSDKPLKIAVSAFKRKFLQSTEALLHGDLHTGSIMVMENSTFIIDPEFAFYGPMGFDIGAYVSNILLNYYSQASKGPTGDAYGEWLLDQLVVFYDTLVNKFRDLWTESHKSGSIDGELYRRNAFNDDALITEVQDDFLDNMWKDTLGYTSCKMIRRIVGIAHVADLESIEDKDVRSKAEIKALTLARQLILGATGDIKNGGVSVANIRELVSRAKLIYNASIAGDVWPVQSV